jgi:hypothetical protein
MTWRWLTFWRWFRAGPDAERARRLFQHQREHLELQFFQAASASGKPRGLRWKAIDWGPAGSDMEGLPAVSNLRNASAVFFFHQGRWHTAGKAVFNLNPDEALAHFRNQYERLPERMKDER